MSVVTSKCTPAGMALHSMKIGAVTDNEAVYFNSVLCYEVQVKIEPYKSIVKYSKNQTI